MLWWMENNEDIVTKELIPKRLIQYNRVLQGLIRSKDNTNYNDAIWWLENMYNQSDFEVNDIDKIEFGVLGLLPNMKPFTTVIEPLPKKKMMKMRRKRMRRN